MPNENSVELARRARVIYNARYRAKLEATHGDDFVAIEPDSGRYFLDDTGSGALQAALAEMPDAHFYHARVGYRTADALGSSYASRIG